jgi:hypothetical protein
MDYLAYGTLGYAGLPAEKLLARGRALFAQSQPEVPQRFSVFLPLFPRELTVDMPYIGKKRGVKTAPNGFLIDPTEYHARLCERFPDLYEGDNRLRNFTYDGRYVGTGAVTVDNAWADRFPQYQAFLGDKLCVYLIGGGSQAVAVPESVYPRGGSMLAAAEEALGVTQRAGDFARYVWEQVNAGQTYDADVLAADYLQAEELQPFCFTQAELEGALQELSVYLSLRSDAVRLTHYTRNARLSQRVRQYVPMRYACDRFAPQPADERLTKLAQLYYADNDFIGDLWIPYADAYACVDRRTMALDARALCEAFQIAPRYDPETGGGRYPDAVRVAAVCDAAITPLAAEARNNPAYGSGQSPQGGPALQICVPNSREQVRRRGMTIEKCSFTVGNLPVKPERYRRMLTLAVLQEHKGRLVDALYRREIALRLIDTESPTYEKAHVLLIKRADKLASTVDKEAAALGDVPLSGYDAEIDYLRRMGLAREDAAGFTHNAETERGIEGGYAMRAAMLRRPYAETEEPPPFPETDDGEDEPAPPETVVRNADTSGVDAP